jgi:hypothetical protein
MTRLHDPNHDQLRDTLRVVGPLIVVVGLVFTAIGFVSFFSSFGSFSGPPKHFWCAFVGLPMVGVGGMICQFAFLGKIARYTAGEIAPVGKDVANYMMHGTKDAMREVAGAIGEGLRGDTVAIVCGACKTENDPGSNFCKGCGGSIAGKDCPGCGKANDADAKFCTECGAPVAAE